MKTTDFGAFVELKKGTDGLLHVSNVGPGRVAHIEDVISRGDVLDVIVQEVDKMRGRIGPKLVAKHEDGARPSLEELIERAKAALPRERARSARATESGRGGRGRDWNCRGRAAGTASGAHEGLPRGAARRLLGVAPASFDETDAAIRAYFADVTYDAIVVGAGPAGSTCAYRLSRGGAALPRPRGSRATSRGGGVTVRARRAAGLDPARDRGGRHDRRAAPALRRAVERGAGSPWRR